jgi:hypothetical protein
MLKLVNYFQIFSFFRSPFELDHIGELSSYTYDELCIHLSHFEKTVKFKESAMIVTWESARTVLIIKYDLDGAFIDKLNEKWK